MRPIVFHEDPLAGLATSTTQQERLVTVHQLLRARCPGIDRVSVALYDRSTQTLKTFLASPLVESPLKHYEARLDSASSLADVSRTATPRIVNDLACLGEKSEHARAIAGHGFASSYTHPIYHDGGLAGFVFFNSLHKRYFRDRVLEQAEIFVYLISEMVLHELAAAHALVASIRTSVALVQMHDLETGSHLERMARYVRLIARALARQGLATLDDERIEQMTLFAPLHDVGKLAIPELILRKPGRLDCEERKVMNSHALLGRQMVDVLITNFGFEQIPYIDTLRNMAEQHHEAMDGSGYPYGLIGDNIALESRIVAVCDIFDALTTRRPYKEAWTNEQAFAMLQLLSLDRLDRDCVSALTGSLEQIHQIQGMFYEEELVA